MSGFYHRFELRLFHGICCVSFLLTQARLHAQAPEEDIRGPRDLVEIPAPEKFPLGLYLAVAVALVVIAIVWYFLKRQSRKKAGKSPLAIAFASLTELATTREALTAEAFANRAAQTVRHFISEQFGIVAPRRTTEEFLNLLANDVSSPLGKESDHLRLFLKSCDLAKFAGINLSSSQRDELLQAARGFVTASSAPVLPPPPQAPKA